MIDIYARIAIALLAAFGAGMAFTHNPAGLVVLGLAVLAYVAEIIVHRDTDKRVQAIMTPLQDRITKLEQQQRDTHDGLNALRMRGR